VSNSWPAGQLPGRVGHGGGALRPSKRWQRLGRPRDERPTTTAGVESLMWPSLTQTLLPAAPSTKSRAAFNEKRRGDLKLGSDGTRTIKGTEAGAKLLGHDFIFLMVVAPEWSQSSQSENSHHQEITNTHPRRTAPEFQRPLLTYRKAPTDLLKHNGNNSKQRSKKARKGEIRIYSNNRFSLGIGKKEKSWGKSNKGLNIERRWRKSRDESDRTHLRAHYRAYAVAVRAAKKRFFSASIASSQCRPAELFRVVQGLVRPGPKEDLIPPSKARCDDFARHFREKIAQIRHELDTTIDSEVSKETPTLPSGPDLLDEFQLLRPDDVDKVLERVRPTTCLLDPCPSWLINDSKHGIGTWILEVVNASLREGRVPAPLKEAVVRPVLKKASLDPEMATNYRPVANIPFLGKVLERVVAGQLQALLDETDYLDPLQSGFRPGYGTESALVALYDDLCREKDRGSASLLVLLDLSAAFDTIDHGILLDRLAGLGVGGTALQWFRSYLNGRFQKVVLGDYGSAPWQLCHGVPQGSILSPLLFNIYMKPLGEVIRRRCGLRNHQYADDTQLYLSFSTNPGEAVAVLNRCLAEVREWMRANKLKLNPDKTEVLLVGGSGFGEGGFDLVLNGATLPLRDKVRSLGVLLDPELSLEAQVTAVARNAFLQLRLINQLRPYLEYDCLATVTHALVTSRLDFCNALYVGLPLKTVRTLQLVQNRAASQPTIYYKCLGMPVNKTQRKNVESKLLLLFTKIYGK
ncbi:hypothetical protein EYD10_05421, partial [Varanus komodoensis]